MVTMRVCGQLFIWARSLVAEIYAPEYGKQVALARAVLELFEQTPGVVDVDWYVESPQPKYRLAVDKEKAALHGISTAKITDTLRLALGGTEVGLLHLPREKEDVPLFVRLPREERSSIEALTNLKLVAREGALVPLSELVRAEETTEPPFIYRK